MQLLLSYVIFVSSLLGTSSCDEENGSRPVKVPDIITLTQQGLFPEGIAYDERSKTIYLSSIRKGKIVKVDFEGNITDFVVEDKLKSTLGLVIDKDRDRLLVCNADPGFSEKTSGTNPPMLASLLVYDLNTGSELHEIDLTIHTPEGSPHLANDVVLDDQGNAYVTSSLTPAVFKVTPAGETSLVLLDASLAPIGESFGLNGLEWHPDGYLILAHYSQGKLYKVPLSDPQNFTEVVVDEKINTIDGILLTDSNELVVVSNLFDPSVGNNTIHQLTSIDDWATASITASIPTDQANQFPTTAALIEGELMVVYSFLFELAANGNSNFEDFSIRKFKF